MVRGIRGATTVDADRPESIVAATGELLRELARANGLVPDRIISVIFTATPDLRSQFPAVAARELGWSRTALLDAVEIDKPGAMPRCIRVLIHAEMPPDIQPVHVYLRDAVSLRPDLAGSRGNGSDTEP